ncbi:hypothetical protein DVH24_010124 [Malus domestica]|uniref:Uncharacterized protein n=1 Tax=Malus domestica TaxID=3750 RepID=A0A498JPC9_MALDO|nr:hypothetical protein DVH24_010124 [Malus domestica]
MEESGLMLCSHPLVEGRHVRQNIHDLNNVPREETADRAIVPYETPISETDLTLGQPLALFGAKILSSNAWIQKEAGLGVDRTNWENLEESSPSYVNLGEYALFLGSDPFNLDPFIFGTGRNDGRESLKRMRCMKGKRRLKSDRPVLPELGKRMQ